MQTCGAVLYFSKIQSDAFVEYTCNSVLLCSQRCHSKCVSEATFYRLVQSFAVVLFEWVSMRLLKTNNTNITALVRLDCRIERISLWKMKWKFYYCWQFPWNSFEKTTISECFLTDVTKWMITVQPKTSWLCASHTTTLVNSNLV